MFGETTISYIKIWNHPIETTIYEQMFQVPGRHVGEQNLQPTAQKNLARSVLM